MLSRSGLTPLQREHLREIQNVEYVYRRTSRDRPRGVRGAADYNYMNYCRYLRNMVLRFPNDPRYIRAYRFNGCDMALDSLGNRRQLSTSQLRQLIVRRINYL
jgi:hypothetical protein